VSAFVRKLGRDEFKVSWLLTTLVKAYHNATLVVKEAALVKRDGNPADATDKDFFDQATLPIWITKRS
jgi:hypothetical protein